MNFRLLNGKQCAKNGYRGSYSKDDALRKCHFDESCSGVYDDNCDDKDDNEKDDNERDDNDNCNGNDDLSTW